MDPIDRLEKAQVHLREAAEEIENIRLMELSNEVDSYVDRFKNPGE